MWETVSLFCLTLFMVHWDSICWWDSFCQQSSVCFALRQSPCSMLSQTMKQWDCRANAVCVQCILPFISKERSGHNHISPAIQILPVLWTFLSYSQLCDLSPKPDIWRTCPWMGTPALSPQLCHLFSPWSLLLVQGNANHSDVSQPYSNCFSRFSTTKGAGFFPVLPLISSRESLNS